MAQNPSGRLFRDSASNQLLRKILISRDSNRRQFAAFTRIDGIDDLERLTVLYAVPSHGGFGFKVAQRLQVIFDIAPAFVQQIVVNRPSS